MKQMGQIIFIRWTNGKNGSDLQFQGNAGLHLSERMYYIKQMKQYHSQSVDMKAIQFINLDMVYWRRPTESLTYHADIEVSSGNAAYLNDFKCADCSDIMHGMWNYDTGSWIPEKDDQKKQVKITLDHKARIQEIHLFENPADDCAVNKVKISFETDM